MIKKLFVALLLTFSVSEVSAKDPLQVYVVTTCGETIMTYLTGDEDADEEYLRDLNIMLCGIDEKPIYFN